MEVFSGVGVALVTFFDRAGEVDATATAAHAADLVARGMRAVLVAGTTGEAGQLTGQERIALIRAVRAALPAEVPVLAGTGTATAQSAVELTTAAVRAGADAVLAYPPPGSADLAGFFDAVAAAAAGLAGPGLPRAVDLRPWRAGRRPARSPDRWDQGLLRQRRPAA